MDKIVEHWIERSQYDLDIVIMIFIRGHIFERSQIKR